MEVMEAVMEELKARSVYLCEIYAPYYVCSFMTHAFNQMNQRREIYWDSKRVPNMRLHILFVAPAGFMKSFYMGTMGGERFSIFRNCGIPIGFEQSMTEAAFVGTIRDIDGVGHPTLGAAADYKDGMLLIDEFSALTNAMKVQYNSQMDAQLLAALDHGHVVKRLGTGRIEYTTNLTLWAGVQPAKYDLSSGLGRRMCFLLFLPTKLDNVALMRTMHKTRNIRPDVREMDNLWGLIKNSVSNMECIETIDFGDSVLKLYEELNLFSYESSYFDRLLLGWHLATYGPEPHMMIEAQDKELLQLVNREKKWRDEIAAGVDHAQMMKIIKTCGSSIDGKLQITKPDLIQECTMVGWNARQVADVLTELTRFGMIENHGARVVVLE